jgi:hypothetical protein
MCTMFVMFTDELVLGFEKMCSILTGLLYGEVKLEFHYMYVCVFSSELN